MKRRVTGTATVKPESKWIYAGETLKILYKRDAGEIEKELGLGDEYTLSLEGTRHTKYKYTKIHAVDLIVKEDDIQLADTLIDVAIERINKDIEDGDVSAIFEMLRFVPVKNLIAFLPEERQEEFKELLAWELK